MAFDCLYGACPVARVRPASFLSLATSLWNAAHDDTIPDPVAKKASFTGLHNAGWLWNTGDHTTGMSVHDITGQDTHVPFH